MSTLKTYANFNSCVFQGRIFDATVVDGQYGEFVALTIITNLTDDSDGVTITFNNSNGLLSLAKKGYLTKGRMVHVSGHISGVSEVWEKDGQMQLRKRPQLTLDSASAQVTLGAAPKGDAPVANNVVARRVSQDATPPITRKEITSASTLSDISEAF